MATLELTSEEKDRLLVQRQQAIDALVSYISKLLKANEGMDNEKTISLDTFREYISSGGEVKVNSVSVLQAERAMELMDFFKADYFFLNRKPNEEGADYIMFMTREDQQESVDKALETLEFEHNTHLTWIKIEDFLRLNVGNELCRITINREDVTALSQELDDTGLMFSINFLDDDRADVYFHAYDRAQMTECIDSVYEKLGIKPDYKQIELTIDSAYEADKIAKDKERPENTETNSHTVQRYLAFDGLTH